MPANPGPEISENAYILIASRTSDTRYFGTFQSAEDALTAGGSVIASGQNPYSFSAAILEPDPRPQPL